ncbi:MAG: hyuE [Herminiimonas sp.]|nr:hyuE [Herminiimonas sp.]
MRILLLNGNISTSVTESLAAEARMYAAPGTEIVATQCSRGAAFVASRASEVVAANAMLEAVAAYQDQYDAILVAISFDTAVAALREMLPVPVIGMTEAACHVATMVSARFGVVVPGARSAAVYRERMVGNGFGPRLAGMRVVGPSAAVLYGDPESALQSIHTAAQALVEEDGCEAVILAGAALVGMHHRLQPRLPVPVIDGIACGVGMLETLVRLKLPKPQYGSYALPEPAQLEKIDPALAELFANPQPSKP